MFLFVRSKVVLSAAGIEFLNIYIYIYIYIQKVYICISETSSNSINTSTSITPIIMIASFNGNPSTVVIGC